MRKRYCRQSRNRLSPSLTICLSWHLNQPTIRVVLYRPPSPNLSRHSPNSRNLNRSNPNLSRPSRNPSIQLSWHIPLCPHPERLRFPQCRQNISQQHRPPSQTKLRWPRFFRMGLPIKRHRPISRHHNPKGCQRGPLNQLPKPKRCHPLMYRQIRQHRRCLLPKPSLAQPRT